MGSCSFDDVKELEMQDWKTKDRSRRTGQMSGALRLVANLFSLTEH
jgi:hypothetical protein